MNVEVQDAQNTIEVLHEISNLLNTGLDRESLSLLVGLCESGVNPEALAATMKEIRNEANSIPSTNQ